MSGLSAVVLESTDIVAEPARLRSQGCSSGCQQGEVWLLSKASPPKRSLQMQVARTSTIQMVWPTVTLSPSLTNIGSPGAGFLYRVPAMGATISTPLPPPLLLELGGADCSCAAGAAGAAGAGAACGGAGAGAAAGAAAAAHCACEKLAGGLFSQLSKLQSGTSMGSWR